MRCAAHPAKPVWQRNYFERIVRKQGELLHIEQYIAENPALWDKGPSIAIELPWHPIH